MSENLDQSKMLEPRRTFDYLLTCLSEAEEFLGASDFDVSVITTAIETKVEGLQKILAAMEGFSAHLKAQAEPLLQLSRSIARNRDRLRERIVYVMQENGKAEIGGERYRIRLRDSPASLDIQRPANADDAAKWPQYVKISYEWDKTAIKADKIMAKAPADLPGTLKVGHWPEFKLNKPQSLEKKK